MKGPGGRLLDPHLQKCHASWWISATVGRVGSAVARAVTRWLGVIAVTCFAGPLPPGPGWITRLLTPASGRVWGRGGTGPPGGMEWQRCLLLAHEMGPVGSAVTKAALFAGMKA